MNLPELVCETQSHLRIQRLASTTSDAVRDFHGALGRLRSLETMGSHRQALLKSLNSGRGKLVVLPFVGEEAVSALIELYQRCDRFLEARSDPSVVDEFRRVEEAAAAVRSALAGRDTSFSEALIECVENLSTSPAWISVATALSNRLRSRWRQGRNVIHFTCLTLTRDSRFCSVTIAKG